MPVTRRNGAPFAETPSEEGAGRNSGAPRARTRRTDEPAPSGPGEPGAAPRAEVGLGGMRIEAKRDRTAAPVQSDNDGWPCLPYARR